MLMDNLERAKDEQAEQELEPEIKYFFNSSSQMFLLIERQSEMDWYASALQALSLFC